MYRTVFFGTPEFAVSSLDALYRHPKVEIRAVVTQPDRPKGRGLKGTESPVKIYALEKRLAVLQPETLVTRESRQILEDLEPDLFIVAAYGKILKNKVLSIPRSGCFNVHGSLLPKYRGAAPIAWAVINGEKETGITIMAMDEGMDTGAILLCESIEIASEDTAADVHDRLANLGGKLISRFIDQFEAKSLNPVLQDDAQASYAPKLTKEDAQIDWKAPATKIHNFIRGLYPFPVAWTYSDEGVVRIYRANPEESPLPCLPPGSILLDGKKLLVATGDGFLRIIELQQQNKKRIDAPSFINGLRGRNNLRFIQG